MQFRFAEARVRELEPRWRATPQVAETAEGQARGFDAMAREANARYFELRNMGVRPISETPKPISPPEPPPRVPPEPPATSREVNVIVRSVAGWLAEQDSILGLFEMAEAGTWIYEQFARVDSFLDPPMPLEELQRLVDEPAFGYDIHHIVEKGPALREGFSDNLVNGRGNLVRIPTFKHWALTGWFGTPNDRYGGLSPRDYVRGKVWDERTKVGLHALRIFGILER